MVKMTFTMDEETAEQLRQAASRLRRPQSQIVRQAIRDYADRIGTLSEEERSRLLEIFDHVVPAIPARPLADVESEIAEVRATRRRATRTRRR